MNDNILVDANKIGCAYVNGQSQVIALRSATCQVRSGQHIALVGPSGSGKSTFLQLLGGLEIPTTGQIQWPALGERSSLRPMKIGYVHQSQSLIAPLTIVENVELPLLIAQLNAKEARLRAIIELERIGLSQLANKLPEELSGGQAQRAAFARVMACRPRLILADEPTGQLDLPTAQHLFDVLLAALADTDTALIVATHDFKVAERLDTIWSMKQGRLELSLPC